MNEMQALKKSAMIWRLLQARPEMDKPEAYDTLALPKDDKYHCPLCEFAYDKSDWNEDEMCQFCPVAFGNGEKSNRACYNNPTSEYFRWSDAFYEPEDGFDALEVSHAAKGMVELLERHIQAKIAKNEARKYEFVKFCLENFAIYDNQVCYKYTKRPFGSHRSKRKAIGSFAEGRTTFFGKVPAHRIAWVLLHKEYPQGRVYARNFDLTRASYDNLYIQRTPKCTN